MKVKLLAPLHELATGISHAAGSILERADGEHMIAHGIAQPADKAALRELAPKRKPAKAKPKPKGKRKGKRKS